LTNKFSRKSYKYEESIHFYCVSQSYGKKAERLPDALVEVATDNHTANAAKIAAFGLSR
jgi:hypothetical protein